MKKAILLITSVLCMAACQEKESEPAVLSQVRIDPIVTRALSLNFNTGNKIGLDIIKADSKFADNACLTFDGTVFSGDQKWYAEGGESCTIAAYYPYSAEGFPANFSVQTDQSAGTDASDFMTAYKTGVLPSEAAVTVPFKHHFAQIIINLDNKAGVEIGNISVTGLITTAAISRAADGTVTATAAQTEAAAIKPEAIEAGKKYCVVVVPQNITKMGINLSLKNGASIITGVSEGELKSGYTYSVNIVVSASYADANISGSIEGWQDGGSLSGQEEKPNFIESENSFTYYGETYKIVSMKDGKKWMAENLRYVPEGMTACSDLNNVAGGIYYPVKLNAEKTAAEFATDAETIKSNGYLYQSEVALGLKVNGITSQAQAEALEGAQGICPKGWHIPTSADILGLVGKAVSPLTNNLEAPYYDAATANSSMAKLNEDGFNAACWGAVSINDNTRTAATLMGYLKTVPDKLGSGYVCGSTFASISNNSDGSIKNVQFYGMMPMAAAGSFNGSKLSYKIAAAVRCVKN